MDCSFNAACRGSRVIGFDFCPEHLATPSGQQHALTRISSGALFTEEDLENEIERRSGVPDTDYHTSALEKMDKTLTQLLDFTDQTKRMLFDIPSQDWRYSHRTAGEQTRMEVGLYERALDRAARVLKDVSKMALEEKRISLGKLQVELIIRILMGTVVELGLEANLVNMARGILLRRLQEEGNLSSKLEQKVTAELEGGLVIDA
jgi:hypothetical protein